MNWRRYLQLKTRDPQFLWRMVITILVAGFAIGLIVDASTGPWLDIDAERIRGILPTPEPEPPPVPPSTGFAALNDLAAEQRWLAVFLGIPSAMVESWRFPAATALALLTGVCWLAFAMQAVQPQSARSLRFWGPPLAVALGVASIWLTLFLLIYQEHRWRLIYTPELVAGLRFFLAGVAFREELAKLLCFLPLLPFAVRARDQLAALVLAACVGLGFAMEENISYIAGSGGTATLTRLLIPAPFHMATTGLLGLSAYRACRWPREWGLAFIPMFGAIVFLHGLYDALLSLPALVDYAFFAQLGFILLMYQFFRELRPLQEPRATAISLTANFLVCVTTVVAATFVYLAAAAGWQIALQLIAASAAGEAIMVYMFLREMPETLVRV